MRLRNGATDTAIYLAAMAVRAGDGFLHRRRRKGKRALRHGQQQAEQDRNGAFHSLEIDSSGGLLLVLFLFGLDDLADVFSRILIEVLFAVLAAELDLAIAVREDIRLHGGISADLFVRHRARSEEHTSE